MSLDIVDVSVRYERTTAVSSVSLGVAPGEVVALLGPSGCGKSSLLRAVAGLEPLAGGDVRWDGRSVAAVPVHRRGFGLVFQDGQLFPHRDVAGNVGYAGPSSRARVDELLTLVGLDGYRDRAVATLSGGERQRVALARALAPAPRLLLLDEPLSALDRSLRERLAVDLRAALVATGTTALFVTHDQDEAFAVADRVAVLSSGRLLQVAAPHELWRRPASRVVAEFLGYEVFVPVGSAAARSLGVVVGEAGASGGTVALAQGAFVLSGTGSGAGSGAGRDAPAKGAVLGQVPRRGRTEVRVDVAGIGPVTTFAAAGTTWQVGDVVALDVDPDALAVLPEEP